MAALRFALVEVSGASAASLAQVYADFIVSGHSLSQLLQLGKAHQTGVFFAGQSEMAVARRIQVFTTAPRHAPERTHFFVCAECGDLACGAVTARIDVHDDRVVWQDFGWDFGNDEPDTTNAESIGPFVFDRTEYVQAFADLQNLLRGR